MARPRQFDRDQVLLQAIKVFCEKGFAAASTDELMQAMGLSRQSMYNTFGDKRQLYLEAMRAYQAHSIDDLVVRLNGEGTALQALENTLLSFASRAEREGTAGCMAVNAICEFGLEDAELNRLNEHAGQVLWTAFETTLRRAVEQRALAADTDIAGACGFLMATLTGMKVSAKGGMGAQALRAIARFAVNGLKMPAEAV